MKKSRQLPATSGQQRKAGSWTLEAKLQTKN
jgi:hypothetical protein